MATGKSKILIIGATGRFGKFIVEASTKAGHETFALVRDSTLSNLYKAKIIETFKSLGVKFIHGDLNDYESLVKAIKQVNVAISMVGSAKISDQVYIIAAIKEAGNIKEDNIATYMIRAVHDPRPPGNIYSFNKLVSLWEKKIGYP